MDWYYKLADKKIGPIDDDQLKQLASQGTITAETLVWNELVSKWRSYGDLTGQATAAAQPSDIKPSVSNPAFNNAAPNATSSADEAWEPFSYLGKSTSAAQSNSDAPFDTNSGAKYESAAEASADSLKLVRCSECGREYPDTELVHYGNSKICAECKPLFFQKLMEGTETAGSFQYGGFWIRFVAKFIDGLIMWTVGMLITVLAGFSIFGTHNAFGMTPAKLAIYVLINILQFALGVGYSTFFVGKYGATPGKMALGLRIVNPDGGKVSYLKALGRHFAELISSMTFLIGYIMAAFDDEKRALHDRICSTRVIRKPA